MRATTLHDVRDIRFGDVPDPVVSEPTDAIVRVVAGCICGSDLWGYRGENGPITQPRTIGHECLGEVVEVGPAVRDFKPGDLVVVPFCHCDGTCPHCLAGMQSGCVNYAMTVSGQGEYARVNQADGSLVKSDAIADAALVPSLLTLSDVMPTGWHAAVAAQVRPGSTVVVIGHGAVGLCGVLAASAMGAERIIAMSRHADRQALAREFGATHIVAERGEEGIEAVRNLSDGIGVDCVLECVGTKESMDQALRSARPGGQVGYVGVPNGGPELPIRQMFGTNVGVRGGVAPVRGYIDELLPDVRSGAIEPGRVFDLELPLDDIAEAYAAMDERRAVKVLLRP